MERWTYGVVTGYRWSESPDKCILHIATSSGNLGFVYDKHLLQDLAAETYAMRLCEGKPVLTVMPAEMRAIHEAAYEAFHARGCSAVRSLDAICRKIGVEDVSEAGIIPLFDISSMEVAQVSAKYVLDFVFYHEGKRRAPSSVTFGESIFDEPGKGPATTTDRHTAASATNSRTGLAPLQEPDGDSDDSLEGGATEQPATAGRNAPKRQRDYELEEFEVRAVARQRRKDKPEQSTAPHQRLLDAGPSDAGGKGLFRASRLQNTVHMAIVNGTYANMASQLFVEHLQAQIELLAFLPHPAVLKCFYAWEFRTRGLSILHFGRLNTSSRRVMLAKYDMCDFSSSNSLPRPVPASGLDDILAALDVLALLVEEVYQPFVAGVLRAARKFFLRQKTRHIVTDAEALADLVFWVDERLEKIRTLAVLGSTEQCGEIQREFNVAHESYVQVQNAIHERELQSLRRGHAMRGPQPSGKEKSDGRQRTRAGGSAKRLPDNVVSALPKENGQQLCMRYLSNQGCRGTALECTSVHRRHFQPRSLPGVVKEFIAANYGGLKPEFMEL